GFNSGYNDGRNAFIRCLTKTWDDNKHPIPEYVDGYYLGLMHAERGAPMPNNAWREFRRSGRHVGG
ncbi:MAG: hypothetical protein VW239_07335, partial [Candidatus Nanopelagicales bacterium]